MRAKIYDYVLHGPLDEVRTVINEAHIMMTERLSVDGAEPSTPKRGHPKRQPTLSIPTERPVLEHDD